MTMASLTLPWWASVAQAIRPAARGEAGAGLELSAAGEACMMAAVVGDVPDRVWRVGGAAAEDEEDFVDSEEARAAAENGRARVLETVRKLAGARPGAVALAAAQRWRAAVRQGMAGGRWEGGSGGAERLEAGLRVLDKTLQALPWHPPTGPQGHADGSGAGGGLRYEGGGGGQEEEWVATCEAEVAWLLGEAWETRPEVTAPKTHNAHTHTHTRAHSRPHAQVHRELQYTKTPSWQRLAETMCEVLGRGGGETPSVRGGW